MARATDPRTERAWRQRLARYRRSGLTVLAFCSAEGVSTASFYAWKRRLERGSGRGRCRGPASASPSANGRRPSPSPPLFVPVTLKDRSSRGAGTVPQRQTGLRIELPSGVLVHVPAEQESQLAGILRSCIQATAESPEQRGGAQGQQDEQRQEGPPC